MPVKWVLHWLPNSGVTVNSQILSEISQSVESLNAIKGARWKAVLTFYKPILRVQTDQSFTGEFPRDFMGLSFSDQPDKHYFIIRGQRLVIEADSTIQTIMEKLQSYKQRVSLNFEGTQYLLGDFQVRVEKVTPSQSESMRGIVMEVEYLPTSSLEKARQILEEFVEALQEAVSKKTLPGHLMHYEPNFTEYGLPDQYGIAAYHGPVCHCDGPVDRDCAICPSNQELRCFPPSYSVIFLLAAHFWIGAILKARSLLRI